MAIGRITGQMLSSTLSRGTTNLTIATTGEANLLVVDASNDRIGIGLNNPSAQFQTSGNVIIGGDLTVNGTTNTINSTTVTVDDKNIELGSTSSPSDAGADGGGITLKGDSDKTINWVNSTGYWTSNVGWDLTSGNAYHIGGTQVLDANNLDLESMNINGSVISSNSNADISIQPSGTGVLKLSGLSIDGDVLTSDDSTAITIGEALIVQGDFKFDGGVAVNTILDEDNMASDSATSLATQQSIKAYVDTSVSAVSTTSITQGNTSAAVSDSGSDGTFTVTADGNTEMTVTDAGMQLGGSGARVNTILDEDAFGSNSDTALATQQSIKAYVDSQVAAGNTLTIGDESSTEISIDLDATLNVKGGNSITSSVAGDTLTFALDDDITVDQIAAKDSSSINITSPIQVTGNINTDTSLTIAGTTIDGILDEDAMGSDSATKLATQQSIKAYVDAQDANIASDTLTLTNKTFDANGTGNSLSNVEVADFAASAIVIESEGISSNDNDTTIPTSAAVKDLVDTSVAALSQNLKVSDDSSTVLTLDLKNDTLSIVGGEGLDVAISGDEITVSAEDASASNKGVASFDATDFSVSSGAVTLQAERIQDIAGAMFGSNTETLITATYQDGDGTIDLVVDNDLSNYDNSSSAFITASSTDTLTNKTFDANGTGNSISNIEVADMAAAAVITVAETLASNDSDTAFVTAGAIIDYVDAQDANIASDTLTFTNKTFDANGTGNSITNIEVADLASGVLDTDISTVSASDDTLASAKAIKTYVDAQDANIASDTLTFTNKTFDANASGNSISNIEVADFNGGAVVTESEGIDSSDNDTSFPTTAAVKDYVDANSGGTLTLGDDASNAGSVATSSGEDLVFHSGNSLTGTVTGNGVTYALNDEIVVNAISSSASTFVRINDSLETESAQINSTLTVDGDATVKGSLTVEGTTTYIETTNTKVSDPILLLNNGNSGGSDIDSGFMVERGSAGNNAVFYWNEGDDRFKAVLSTSDSEGTSITDSSYATINAGGLVFSSESVVVTSILDEDAFGSDSNTALATQQSIKAYVDAQDANIASDTLTFTNKTFDANGSGNSISNLEVADFAGSAVITVSETLAANDSDTALVTAGAIIDYVDAQDANIASDTLTFTNKTFDANATGNALSNVEVADFAASAIVLESEGISSNDNDTTLPTSAAVKDFVDTQINALSSTLKVSDDASSVLTLDLKNDTLSVVGGEGINAVISGDEITISAEDASDTNKGVASFDATDFTVSSGDVTVNAERIQDIVGAMTTSNTETLITVTYQDGDGTIDFVVDNDLSNYDNSSSAFITAASTDTLTNKTFDANGTGNSISNIEVADLAASAVVLESEGITSNDNDTTIPTSAAVRDLVDTETANIASDTLTFTNKTFDANGTGNSITNIEVADLASGVLDTDISSVSASDDTLASAKAIKTYVDAQVAGSNTLTIGDESSTEISIDLDDTLNVKGGNSITSSVAGDTLTFALDDSITVDDITAKDSSSININSPIQVTGNINTDTSLTITGTTVDGIVDEDNMASNSATKLATQQSIKAYVDAEDANIASDTLTFTNKTFDANGTGNSLSNVEVADFAAAAVVTEAEGINSSDNDTSFPTTAAVKDYVDTEVSSVSISSIGDIGDVDADNKADGDVLIINDDSSNVFTTSSHMVTGLRVPNGTTAQRPTVYTGIIRFNTTTGKYEGSTDGSSFTPFAMEGGADTLNKDVFSGDGGATYNFSNVSDPTAVNAGTSNGATGLIVYIDNVLQEPTQNYTVSPTAITFDSAVHSGARIVVIQGFDSSVSSTGGGGGLTAVANTDVDSAVENVDTFGTSTFRSAHYHYVIENDDASEYQTGQIHVIHDGTNAQITEFGVLRTGNNDLITFSVDVDSGQCRLRASAQTPNSKFKAKRVSLEVQ